MDIERHVVSVDGEQVALPLKEFELLEMLLRNSGRVLTRGQLIDRVWGSDYVGDTKTLDVHVKRLRSKIEPDPSGPAIPGHRPRPGLQVRALKPRSDSGGAWHEEGIRGCHSYACVDVALALRSRTWRPTDDVGLELGDGVGRYCWYP